MSKASMRGSNWPKTAIQWVSLVIFLAFATGLAQKYLPAFSDNLKGWLGELRVFVGTTPSLEVAVIVVAFLFVVFFTRFFCGYICPVGTVEDALMGLRNGFGINPLKVKPGDGADSFLRIFKYVVLFGLTLIFAKGIQVALAKWMLIAVLAVIVLGGLFIDRFWCKYLCPFGAAVNTARFWIIVAILTVAFWALNLFTKADISWIWLVGSYCVFGYLSEIIIRKTRFHLLRIVKEEDRCSHCGDCARVCPYTLAVSGSGSRLNDVDCTLCGECVAVCRHKALGVGIIKKTSVKRGVARFLPPVLAILFIVALLYAPKLELNSYKAAGMPETEPVEPLEEEAVVADTIAIEEEVADTVAVEPVPAGFQEFGYEVPGRRNKYSNKSLWVYEYVSQSFSDVNVAEAVPVLAQYLAKYEGFVGVFCRYDADGTPVIDMMYANPLRKAEILEAITKSTWTYKDADGASQSVPAAVIFEGKGAGRSYNEHREEFGF